MGEESLGFDRDIRVLFRPRDVDSMSFAFDLSSYDDVPDKRGGDLPATCRRQHALRWALAGRAG
jgi:hypothetical protein